MNHQQKIDWMRDWCEREGLKLSLESECGFGRECVGVLAEYTLPDPLNALKEEDRVASLFPDYNWHDEKTYDRLDPNGDVWTPNDAYHKHPCVAVLGRGEVAEAQLYDWLRWFHDNGFKHELTIGDGKGMDLIQILLGKHVTSRMVRA